MRRFLFSQAKSFVFDQTRLQHHTSRGFLSLLPSLSSPVPPPLSPSTSKMAASDSTPSINPNVLWEENQENVYAPERKFNSFKNVARSLGHGEKNNAFVSFQTVSKGYYGEFGKRGGYMELTGFTSDTLEEAHKNLEGLAMYLFPRIHLPKEETEDAFNRKRLLNATGIVAVPRSRFGQVPGWHLLQQQDKTPATVNRIREFHKSSINDIPRRTKFQKQHRGRVKGTSSQGNRFGRYALQTLEPAWITSRQIEAGRRAMVRKVRRGEKIWVHIFADKPMTTRPPETRMGRGKGSPAFWVVVVKPGKIIYEMGGVSEKIAREAISIAASKLPIKTKFVISE